MWAFLSWRAHLNWLAGFPFFIAQIQECKKADNNAAHTTMVRTQQTGRIRPSYRATDDSAPILGANIPIIANHRSQVRETESKIKQKQLIASITTDSNDTWNGCSSLTLTMLQLESSC